MEAALEFISNYLDVITIVVLCSVAFFFVNKKNKKHLEAKKILHKAVKSGTDEPMTLHPIIDVTKCAGCASCTLVCPEGGILKIIQHKAVLVTPAKCVGHGECERACPYGAIDLVFGSKRRGVDIPRVTTNYETNVPGLYIAGELGGMGLIRNAIKQGTLAAEHAVAGLKGNSSKTDTDILIIGAGPAGLGCGLTAIKNKVSYKLIEQNSFGGTVYNFPRQKVVMTHPADVPGYGQMKFDKNKVSKEELLAYWNGIVKKSGLKIDEGISFENLEKENDVFKVTTKDGKAITAKKVILCMGVRGSPRKLGLDNEDLPKVAYNLIDPEQYKGKHVAVVSGGNAGVEAAQMLAEAKYKNTVNLLVRGDIMDRCNDDNKAIINAMADKGLVTIRYNTVVSEIEKDTIVIDNEGNTEKINNDFIFVFAGAIMPYQFLMSIGIEIDKAHGEKRTD
ncbi:MAG: NAD(P)-binding domain-containing protein [Bdellovibrionaceae bacterium]|jgi:thioredoxin reductase (NADPH)|nr:NAD(P)-binding domain-containing protein [Pseudobdellovibrionaceae bacterium]